jgi:hypothetical protein
LEQFHGLTEAEVKYRLDLCISLRRCISHWSSNGRHIVDLSVGTDRHLSEDAAIAMPDLVLNEGGYIHFGERNDINEAQLGIEGVYVETFPNRGELALGFVFVCGGFGNTTDPADLKGQLVRQSRIAVGTIAPRAFNNADIEFRLGDPELLESIRAHGVHQLVQTALYGLAATRSNLAPSAASHFAPGLR